MIDPTGVESDVAVATPADGGLVMSHFQFDGVANVACSTEMATCGTFSVD